MLAILASVKPKWWEKILAGEKGLEIRKTAPHSTPARKIEWPLPVLVYVSGTGAVQGRFKMPGYVKTNYMPYLAPASCVPLPDLERYANGGSLYGWGVQDPVKYETPAPLAEFGLTRPPMSWQYVEIPDDAEV